jgi:PAS domain S-box-containing protein
MTLDSFCIKHLDKTTKRFKTLIEKRYLLFFLVTPDLKVFFACESIEDLLGRTFESVRNHQLQDALGKENELTLASIFTELTSKNQEKYFIDEMKVPTNEGDYVYFDVEITSKVEDEEIDGFAVFCHNITDTKRLQHRLLETNFELEQLVYAASHDLRAPLLSVEGLVNVAQMEYPNNVPLYLTQIKKSVRRLDNFVTGLIYYAQNERIESIEETVDIPKLVTQVTELWQDHEMTPFVNFFTEHQGETLMDTDRIRMDIILTNIISNAIRYADQRKEKSWVKVITERNPGCLTISVEDNGIGIRKEAQPQVFDMFYKAGERTAGAGLGLYLVKKTVDRLKGKVKLESTYGQGTTVTVTLPI